MGADASTNRATLFELTAGQWTLAAPAGISGVSLNTGWRNFAAGQTGKILRRGATDWLAFPNEETPGNNDLYSMAGAGDEVFVVGAAGTIWRYKDN